MIEEFQKKKDSKAIQNKFTFFFPTKWMKFLTDTLETSSDLQFLILLELNHLLLKSMATHAFIAASDYTSLSI